MVVCKPEVSTYSFVGTEEYLAPEVIGTEGHSSEVDWWCFGILIYELLFGTTPFKGLRRDQTFQNILFAPLIFPNSPNVSTLCIDLIKRLLIKDRKQRLGSRGGAEEIKSHPYFSNINWALVRNQPPPYIVKLQDTQIGQIPVMVENALLK